MTNSDCVQLTVLYSRRILIVLIASLLLAPVLLLTASPASAAPYYNSSEPGCDGTNSDVLWCDDFEDGDWAATYCDVNNPANDGWNMTMYAPGGTYSCGQALAGSPGPGNGGLATGTGIGGGKAVQSGIHSGAGQAYLMGDHTLNGATTTTNGYNEVYFRYYIKKVRPYTEGGQKHFSFNPCCAGIGGIKFAAFTSGGSGPDLLPPDGTATHGESWYVAYEANSGALMRSAQNISPWYWIAGEWYYVEVHIKLNTPGVADGVFELWLNDCGTNGNSCGASPTLRARHTDIQYVGPGDNTKIGSLWLENWANPATSGVEYYDQFKVSKTGPIGFSSTGGGDVTPPAAPTGLRIQ